MRDVIVVGAGPAGSSTSAFLARSGYDVLLLDKEKFPRDKPCGDGQGPRSVEMLKELGVYEVMKEKGCHRLYGAVVSSPNGSICKADIREANIERITRFWTPRKMFEDIIRTDIENLVGFSTPRKIFDNILKDAAIRFGAELIEEFRVTDLIIEDGKVCGVKGKYQGEIVEHRSKLVVGADGAYSIVGRRLGMFHQRPEHIVYGVRAYYENVRGLTDLIEVYFDKDILPGYIWIFPISKDMANVGVGMLARDYNKSSRTLQEYLQTFIATNKFAIEKFQDARMVGHPLGWRLPLGGQAIKNHTTGALLVGDAASFIDPFTGEGVCAALESGKMAAEVIAIALERNDFSVASLGEYERRWRERFEEDFKYSLRLKWLASSPWRVNYLVRKASRDKDLAMLLVGIITNIFPQKAMFKAVTMLKLLRPF